MSGYEMRQTELDGRDVAIVLPDYQVSSLIGLLIDSCLNMQVEIGNDIANPTYDALKTAIALSKEEGK